MSALGAWLAAAATTAVTTPLAARAAHALGFEDRAAAAPERKLQRVPVPPVGGTALLLGLVAARLAGTPPFTTWAALRASAGEHVGEGEGWWWAALGAGYATGLVDDVLPRGLAPAAKLAGQAVAGILFAIAAAPWLGGGPAAFAIAFLAAVLAQNLVNTWDHADGVVTTTGALGLAAPAPAAACALVAFLPSNLRLVRGNLQRGADAPTEPRAYLGDSGSHLVGLLLLASPWSWPALLPCALDLARVVCARVRAGLPAWRGDRRHLAHRLQEAGLGPRAVALTVALVTLPALLPAWARQAAGRAPELDAWQAGGLAASALAWAICTAWTLEPARTGSGKAPT